MPDTSRIVTIPADLLQGGYAVNLQRPTFKDYSTAMKLYPGETRENPQGPGYSFEEFFCALCIRDAQGNEPDKNPKDAIERFTHVDFRDEQFIARTFISGFLLTQDLQDAAEAMADELMDVDPNSLTYTLSKDVLPANSADLTFHRPNTSVRISVTKTHTSPKVNGCLWEELLFLTCLTHINGEAVPQTPNVLTLVSDLEVVDVQFAAAVFYKMFSMSVAQRKSATDLGKLFRTQTSPSAPSNKTKSVSPTKSTEVAKPAS